MKNKRMKNRSDGDEAYLSLEEQEKSRSLSYIQNRKKRPAIMVTINLEVKYLFVLIGMFLLFYICK